MGETRQYNTRLQLTRITASGYQMPAVDLEYRYSATANDGRVTQMKDWAMSEEVNYTYDSLARLSAAWTTGPEWGQAYSYDGWGNLTGKSVTKGSAPTFSSAYDGATNRQVGAIHDANGNLYRSYYTSYDAENRMTYTDLGPMRTFKYDAMNRRVMVQEYSGPEDELSAEEVTFYGPGGERMGVYRRSIYHEPYSIGGFGGGQAQVWFGGKLIQASGQRVGQDRLGTVTVQGSERMRYWPYGEERGTAGQKRQKWATYWRDESGLDYAMARYQQNGRFLSPDPYISSGGPSVPQSWNRYAYVQNDPVNFYDPPGLYICNPNGPLCGPHPLGGGGGDADGMEVVNDGPLEGGGGGGGGGQLHVGNPRKEGEEYLKVQDAFARMMAFLDPDCASFLNSGGGTVSSYVGDLFAHDLLAVGEFDASKAAFTWSTGSDLPEGFAAMTFNTTSAFFNSSWSVNNGRIEGGTAKAQVFIILHELGHALSAQGFRPDLNDAGAGKSNDNLIDSKCKKTLVQCPTNNWTGSPDLLYAEA